MPSKICTQCISQLNTSFTFKQRCERSDATLRDYILRKHPNIKLAPVVKQEMFGDDFHLPIKPEITIVESDPLTENFYEGDNNFDNSDGEVILNHKRSKRTRRGKGKSRIVVVYAWDAYHKWNVYISTSLRVPRVMYDIYFR